MMSDVMNVPGVSLILQLNANIDANVIANEEIADDISIDVDMVQYDLVTL